MSALLPHDSEELSPRRQRNRYQIPTHLDVPDKLSIHLLGWTISVTIRQGLILLLGWSTAFNLWKHLAALDSFGTPGIMLHFVLPGVLALITFVYSTMTIAGRYPEAWAPVLLHYLFHPRRYMWSSLPSPETTTSQSLSVTASTRDGSGRYQPDSYLGEAKDEIAEQSLPAASTGAEWKYHGKAAWEERISGRERMLVSPSLDLMEKEEAL
jgi:hypothetical protein